MMSAPTEASRAFAAPHARRLSTFAAAAALILIGLAANDVRLWLSTPSDGSVMVLSGRPWPRDHVVIDRLVRPDTGLRPGDHVHGVDGRPLNEALSAPARAGATQGLVLTYDITRDGRSLAVPVQLARPEAGAFLRTNASALALTVCVVGVAALVFRRRPGDPSATVLLLVAGLGVLGWTSWTLGLPVSELVAGDRIMFRHWLGELALTLLWGAIWQFVLVFADVPLGRRRRCLLLAGYAGTLLLYAGWLAATLPSARTPLAVLGSVVPVSLVPGLVAPVALVVQMVVVYRRTADPHGRQRQLWVLTALCLAFVLFFAGWVVPAVAVGRPLFSWGTSLLVVVPAPLALGAAILRYRLFDIEIIVRRSLLYGSLTAVVLGLYLALDWALGLLLPGGADNVLALGAALLTFPALRTRLQHVTGRLVYGERDDPSALLARLGEMNLLGSRAEVLQAVAETLARRLRLPYAAIELYGPTGAVHGRADYGTPRTPGGPTLVPLRSEERDLGLLLLDVGPGQEPFGPADRRLLADLARHLGRSASTVLLAESLQESRLRLVTAQEEERRRLGRELHDGLGATLAAAVLHLEAAQELSRRDEMQSDQLVSAAVDIVKAGIADVRRILDDLRPAALDALGLEGALQEQARRLGGAFPNQAAISVAVDSLLPELPAAVEVAVYRIVQESLHNALRHGRARSCSVTVRQSGKAVLVQVDDDGAGVPVAPRPGVGLQSMRERAAELGGSCTVRPRSGNGSSVSARLPLRAGEVMPVQTEFR